MLNSNLKSPSKEAYDNTKEIITKPFIETYPKKMHVQCIFCLVSIISSEGYKVMNKHVATALGF
jgi:hypothetical protein